MLDAKFVFYLHTSDKDKMKKEKKKTIFLQRKWTHMKIYVRQDKYNNKHKEKRRTNKK